MTFEYFFSASALDSIDIEDIGNVALLGFTDNGAEYLLVVSTKLGRTSFYQFGPYIGGTNTALNTFKFTYNQIDYNEVKIINIIDKFLMTRDKTSLITQVFFTDKDEALTRLKEVELR